MNVGEQNLLFSPNKISDGDIIEDNSVVSRRVLCGKFIFDIFGIILKFPGLVREGESGRSGCSMPSCRPVR